jgi:hypothetical protein
MGNTDSQEDARHREEVRTRILLAQAVAAQEAEREAMQAAERESWQAEGKEATEFPDAKRRRTMAASQTVSPRLLGKGSFGCVHSPPIQCADGSFAEFAGDATKVSKYAASAELAREMGVYRSLDRMDPEYRFHLRTYGICKASGPDPPDCFTDYMILEWDKPRSIIVMDRAGPSLAALRARKADVPDNLDLARSYENLVRALAIMADRGLVYGDVNDENVVVGADGLLRFIDFNRAEFTTPEQARDLVLSDVTELQDMAQSDVERYFPERERTHPEEFAALRTFASARLAASSVTPTFSMMQ